MPEEIRIPLLNPNEPDARLVDIHVSQGQKVKPGDLVCTLETTKSTADIKANSAGYLVGVRFEEGDIVTSGEIFAYLADSPDWLPPISEVILNTESSNEAVPEGMRITDPALALARKHNVDLRSLPADIFITREVLQSYLIKWGKIEIELPAAGFNPSSILIYGAGGHGKSVLELIKTLGSYQVVGFLDDGLPTGEMVMGLPVLGGRNQLPKLYNQGLRLAVNAVGGIGNLRVREEVFRTLLDAGFGCPAIVHPRSYLEPSVNLSRGVQIFPFAYLGSEVQVGFGSIINTNAIISHECRLGTLVNVSPGAILAGGVEVGERSLIGMGATVNLLVKIGPESRVGNSATVKEDVPSRGIVPAGGVWP
jgi:sugar O-acyltransferase (sialic acid O-acetyltransferase NeuD family)